MKAVRMCLVVCFALMFASCALKPGWDMVGKWQKNDAKDTIEFSTGGTLSMVSGNTSLTASYKLRDPAHLEINMGVLGPLVLKVALSNNVLSITDANGKVTQYHRVK